jgi:ABC-type uncharacterized transport system permease subunit
VLLSDQTLFLIAVVFYGLSSLYAIFLLRKGFREDNRINYCLLLGGAIFHTVAMLKRGFSLERCPINNLYEATTFVGWTIVAAYGAGRLVAAALPGRVRLAYSLRHRRVRSCRIGPASRPSAHFHRGWMSLHAALILLSYGAFGLSSIAAAMPTQEHNLKFNKLRAVFSLMPPIQRLELVTTGLLLAGFVLLTTGLFIGIAWLKETYGVYFKGDLKVLWSVLVWMFCLALLVSRWRFAQRGRRFAWGTVGMFTFVLLTFWGSNLLSGIHNPTTGNNPPTEQRQ